MKKYLPILRQCGLFEGIGDQNIIDMLPCLDAKTAFYPKGSILYGAGHIPDRLCLIISGEAHMSETDFWGNVSLMSVCVEGDLFGESFVSAAPLPFDITAQRDTMLMTFDIGKVLSTCPNGCPFHKAVVKNLFLIISAKNRSLVSKMGHITKRTTREKVLSFLSYQASMAKNDSFVIPFNRQQLADYLAVDRSALSATLSSMQKQGLLTYRKNHFTLFLREDT